MELLSDTQPLSKWSFLGNIAADPSRDAPSAWERMGREVLEDTKATKLWVLGSDIRITRSFHSAQFPSTCLSTDISEEMSHLPRKSAVLTSSSSLAPLTFLTNLLPWQDRDVASSGHFALSKKQVFVDWWELMWFWGCSFSNTFLCSTLWGGAHLHQPHTNKK